MLQSSSSDPGSIPGTSTTNVRRRGSSGAERVFGVTLVGMGRRIPDESRFVFTIQEHGTTIGGGNRKRDLRYWEAVWDVPADYLHLTKHRQIIGSSKVSKADAIADAEARVEAFLREHALQ